MHAVKHIQITACEGPTYNKREYEGVLFPSFKEADRTIAMLAPRDEHMHGYFKCFVTVTFDDDFTYEARLDLTWSHRYRASILLPHMISHCEVMSGRVVPPAYGHDPDQWEKTLEEMEGSTPNMRAKYTLMLEAYLT